MGPKMCYFVSNWFKALKLTLELVRLDDGLNTSRLTEVLGCKVVKLPIKYLGMPLDAKYKDMRMWDLIVARFERRLAG